ncbi:unnamed protein product [Linum trigynum]|uniref:Uncharacterized protein n=1 Tax=Linum trigynum TaxID=586398 RepID=A0AAV2E9G4_9ROSI
MGFDPTHVMMTKRQYTTNFHYQAAFRAIYHPKHQNDEFEGGHTNVVKLQTPWRILHTLLTNSIIPNLLSGHLITNRGLIALHSMKNPAEPLHLGDVVATTFARCLGLDRVATMHLGGMITRLARHFDVDAMGCSIIGRNEPFPVETLYNMKFVLPGERGIEYLDGLRPLASLKPMVDPTPMEPDLEDPPPEQPPARAPGRSRRAALP